MAGRQRQLVFLTRAARRYNGSGRLVGLLVKCGDLGQAIDVLCTRTAARARAARTMSPGGTR
ncbi:MAG: hypothetical protein ACRDPF_21100 [Streptosporangiaceae bacterium]